MPAPTISTSAPTAPVTAPVSTPTGSSATPANLYANVGGSSLDAQAAAADQAAVAANSQDTISQNLTQSNQDVLNQFQDQLNAIDQAKAEAASRITNAFQPTANARIGGAVASGVGAGGAGGAFGSTAIDNATIQNNNDLMNQVGASNANYEQQRQALADTIQTQAQAEAATRNTASQQGAAAKIAEIQNRTTRAQVAAQGSVVKMLQTGINDPSNPNYLSGINAIASSTGLTPDEVQALYVSTQNSLTATAAANEAAAKNAAVAGQTTIPTGGTVIGPNGTVISSGQNPPTVIPLTSGVTHNLPATGTTLPTSTAPTTPSVTLPTGNTGSTTASTTPPTVIPTNTATGQDSHLPIVSTLNGKTLDKNGDPTTGTSSSAPSSNQTPSTNGLESNGVASWNSLSALPGIDPKSLSLLSQDYASPQDAYNQGIQWILNGGSNSSSGSTSSGGRGAVSGALSNAAGSVGSAILRSYGLTQQDANAISSMDTGLSQNIQTMMGRQATVNQYIQKSQTQAQILNSAITQYGGNGASPLVNSVVQAFQKNIYSDPSFNSMQVALGTFLKDYARVSDNATGSSAATTDASNASAAEKLSTLMSQGSLQSALGTMWEEMNAQVSSLNTSVTGLVQQQSDLIQQYATDKNGGGTSPVSSGSTTQMTGPDGTVYNVPNAKVTLYKQNGYK